jgi:two-component system, cell cycle response regulator
MKCEDLFEKTNGKTRIMLVEDNPAQASVMKVFLENNGHEVIHLENGNSVLKAVEELNPDVVLLNRVMHDIDGTQICRRLKQNRDTSGIPIILLAEKSDLSDKIIGLTSGADDYIRKPYDDEELSAVICARARTKSGWDALNKKARQLQEMLTRVETLANVDSLTGLFNRRRFAAVFDSEFKKAQRYQLHLSCAMLDIDFFKQVNDDHGHVAGDHVLRDTVKIIQNNIREVDTVARWGGEEFVILSPNTPKESARVVAERIREAVSRKKFRSLGDRQVTVSIGIADRSDPTIKTAEQLVKTADVALYEAKNSGRNRVMLSP